ncbi:MAG TPA: hypothetical protein VFV38_00465 [Ktedonobacteraceae bacterium]|nr:hypothetical protein [Ktedonobacteraceae bacterium]
MQHSGRGCDKEEVLVPGMGHDLTDEELATICGGKGSAGNPDAQSAQSTQGTLSNASNPLAPGSLGSLGSLNTMLRNGLPNLDQLLAALGLGGLGI